MRLAVLSVIIFSFISFTATQSAEHSVRELPAWMVYTYHYGVSPVTTALALLARGGWLATKTAAQGAWEVGKFSYENPAAACLVIPANLFIAYKLYKEGLRAWQDVRDTIHEQAIRMQGDRSESAVIKRQEAEPMEIEPQEVQSRKRKRNPESVVVKKSRLNNS